MINVGVLSANSDVSFHMASVVCKLGSHCEPLNEYDFTKLKSFNIVIIDLDNASEWHEQIKKDVSGFEGFIVLGASRDIGLIDVFYLLKDLEILLYHLYFHSNTQTITSRTCESCNRRLEKFSFSTRRS